MENCEKGLNFTWTGSWKKQLLLQHDNFQILLSRFKKLSVLDLSWFHYLLSGLTEAEILKVSSRAS